MRGPTLSIPLFEVCSGTNVSEIPENRIFTSRISVILPILIPFYRFGTSFSLQQLALTCLDGHSQDTVTCFSVPFQFLAFFILNN